MQLANNRFGNFPAISNKVNESDEQFGLRIKLSIRKWLLLVNNNSILPSALTSVLLNTSRILNISWLHWIRKGMWWGSGKNIGWAKTTFFKMKNFQCRHFPLNTRIRVLNCYVWPIVLYDVTSSAATYSLDC